MWTSLFLLLISLHATRGGCGNYCGYRYCGGNAISRASDCDWDAPPESLVGDTCADECCKKHDSCCWTRDDISDCNSEMVDCLTECNPMDITCLNGVVPIPTPVLAGAMTAFSGWCCSVPCQDA